MSETVYLTRDKFAEFCWLLDESKAAAEKAKGAHLTLAQKLVWKKLSKDLRDRADAIR